MKFETVIWKDVHDPDTFILGLRRIDNGHITIWAIIFVDALSDLFDKEFYDACRILPVGVLAPISLSARLLK